jgi:hypothetical protein
MNAPFCVHIGLPKTATTFLQNEIFQKHPGLLSLGKPYTAQPEIAADMNALRSFVSSLDGLEFAARRGEAAPVLQRVRAFAAERAGGRTVLWSDETMSSDTSADRMLVMQRLAEFFPQARILITVRRQADILQSMYLQYARAFGTKFFFCTYGQWLQRALDSYLHSADPAPGLRHIRIANPLSRLFYADLARAYAETFGPDRVLVLDYHLLRSDQQRFYGSLCGFLDIDPQPALDLAAKAPATHVRMPPLDLLVAKHRQHPARHLAARLLRSAAKRAPQGLRRSIEARYGVGSEAPAELMERIAALYRPGNERLRAEFGVDLPENAVA